MLQTQATRSRTAQRVIDILNCFGTEKGEWSLTELASQIGLDKSTVHRILATLKENGYVHQNAVTRKYTMGYAVFSLGRRYFTHLGGTLRAEAEPFLARLRDTSGETACLAMLSNSHWVYVAQAESRQEIRRVVDIGRLYPLHCGAAGKAILAHLPPRDIERYIRQSAFTPLTDRTITDPGVLLKDLENVRLTGYSVSMGETVPGAASVAVPLLADYGNPIGALAVSGPAARFDLSAMQPLIDPLKQSADALCQTVHLLRDEKQN